MRERERFQLSHERLEVYQAAIEFLGLSSAIVEGLPRGHSSLTDQLRRAALSVPLNIAEGAGRTSRADGARYYGIARGSALECGAVLDACVIMGLCTIDTADEGKRLLVRVVSMLSKMAR